MWGGGIKHNNDTTNQSEVKSACLGVSIYLEICV